MFNTIFEKNLALKILTQFFKGKFDTVLFFCVRNTKTLVLNFFQKMV